MTTSSDPDKMLSRLSLAKLDAQLYSNYMISAVEDKEVFPHRMQDLIFDSLEGCWGEGKGCVFVMPPEHCKTTSVVFWLCWMRSRNPGLRVGITAGDQGRALKSMTLIRKALLSVDHQAMFPHIRPDTALSQSRGEWSNTRLYLEGDTSPSFEVFPFEGHAEGARLDIVWCDDVVGQSCKTSEADRERIHGILHGTWFNRLTGKGIAVVTNNVHHREDPIHKLAQSPSFHTLWLGYRGQESIYWRVMAPVRGWEHGVEGELGLWDKVWPRERLLAKYYGDRFYYKQMFEGRAMLAEECVFPPHEEWKVYERAELQRVINDGGRMFAHLDPSGGRNVKKGDFAALVVGMISREKVIYVTDVWCWRASPQLQARQLWIAHEAAHRMGINGGIFQAQIELLPKDEEWITPWLKKLNDEERVKGNGLDLRIGPPFENKHSRIHGILRHFEQNWIKFPWDFRERMKLMVGHWREFVNQIEDFPLGNHDDAPDALAGMIEIAEKNGAGRGMNKAMQRAGWTAQAAREFEAAHDPGNNFVAPKWDEWGRRVEMAVVETKGWEL